MAIFFFDLAENVVKFGGVFLFKKILDELARVGEAIGHDIGQGEIVAVVVGGRFNFLGAFKEGNCQRNFSETNVGFAEVMIGIEAFGREFGSFLELGQGEIRFADAHETGGKVGAGGDIGRLEADGLLEMWIALVVVGLSGVGEAKEFVDFEAVRRLAEEGFELGGRFGVVTGFVLSGGRLKFLVEGLTGVGLLRGKDYIAGEDQDRESEKIAEDL